MRQTLEEQLAAIRPSILEFTQARELAKEIEMERKQDTADAPTGLTYTKEQNDKLVECSIELQKAAIREKKANAWVSFSISLMIGVIAGLTGYSIATGKSFDPPKRD